MEFVDIDERGSAYPSGGWLTRVGLEKKLPEWGASVLCKSQITYGFASGRLSMLTTHLPFVSTAKKQKEAQEALERSQTPGSRSKIDFASSSGTSSSRMNSSSSRMGAGAGVNKGYDLILPGMGNEEASGLGSGSGSRRNRHRERERERDSGRHRDKDGRERERDRDRDRDRASRRSGYY